MKTRPDNKSRERPHLRLLSLLAFAFLVSAPFPAATADTAYVIQYEIRYGRQQTTTGMYFAFLPRRSVDGFNQQYVDPDTKLSILRDQNPRLPLFGAGDESDGKASGSECGGLCVLFGLAVIGGSIWALQEEGDLEECLARGAILGHC